MFKCTSVAVQVDDSDTSEDEDENKAEDDEEEEEEEDDNEAMEDDDEEEEEELGEEAVDQSFRLELMKVLQQQNALVGLKSQNKPKSALHLYKGAR